MTTRYRKWMCHYCGHIMDAASHLTDDALVPREGDLSACIACGGAHTLHGGRWQKATEAELAGLGAEARRELTMTQLAIGEMIRVMGKPPGAKGGGRA